MFFNLYILLNATVLLTVTRPVSQSERSSIPIGRTCTHTRTCVRRYRYLDSCVHTRALTTLVIISTALARHFSVTRRQLRTLLYKPRILC